MEYLPFTITDQMKMFYSAAAIWPPHIHFQVLTANGVRFKIIFIQDLFYCSIDFSEQNKRVRNSFISNQTQQKLKACRLDLLKTPIPAEHLVGKIFVLT